MELIKKVFDSLLVYKNIIHKDNRGYFFEAFNKHAIEKLDCAESFVQDNISRSVKNTIRGLHYQIGKYAQGKFCRVIYGKVLDVAVDIRFGSPTFGEHFAIELDDESNLAVFIPTGFAHGFSVLSEEAVFFYKCTNYYSKKDERGIHYKDSHLDIDWKVNQPIISEKDNQLVSFNSIEMDFIYKNINDI